MTSTPLKHKEKMPNYIHINPEDMAGSNYKLNVDLSKSEPFKMTIFNEWCTCYMCEKIKIVNSFKATQPEQKRRPYEWILDKEFHHIQLVKEAWKSVWNRKVTRDYMRKNILSKKAIWNRNYHKHL